MLNLGYWRFKRILDVIGAVIGLILLSPIILLTSLAIKIFLGSPIIFKQERPGINENIFTLLKFRSMKNIDESAGLISDAARLSNFGRILRSTSLDELPSLWNVLVGDMSFVGPRPLLVEYLDIYDDSQRKRHEVKPGITGLAQVKGRNSLDWGEKFAWDLEYVENMCFTLDAKIVLKTIKVILKRSGITSPGSETSNKFEA